MNVFIELCFNHHSIIPIAEGIDAKFKQKTTPKTGGLADLSQGFVLPGRVKQRRHDGGYL